MKGIEVWREYKQRVEHVGSIRGIDDELHFEYDRGYRGQAISASLPVQKGPCPARETACFFSALIPEGPARRRFAQMFHVSESEFAPFLERFNDESIGALLFSVDDNVPYSDPYYERVETGFFERLAKRSFEVSLDAREQTRLSLSGAMAKLGLYREERTGEWYFPHGGAPSTHIIKASDSANFPLETLNEALCLGVARRSGFSVAESSLIGVEGSEPLLVLRRFDRVFGANSRRVGDMPAPARIHQEDFSQAMAFSQKYEPTDGNYLNHIAVTASRVCENGFGEASLLFEYTLFDYLIGNCDNHLKNYALVYDESWNTCEVAPLYDVVSTAIYPEIAREMGVSFGGDRKIDHVTMANIYKTAHSCGISEKLVDAMLSDLVTTVQGAVEEETDELFRQGFQDVKVVAEKVLEGIEARSQIWR